MPYPGERSLSKPSMSTDEFAQWLYDELQHRGWSRREAARRGEISASMFDKVIGGYAKPGLEFCNAVARAFKITRQEVLRRVVD